jgi:hypothetical protein
MDDNLPKRVHKMETGIVNVDNTDGPGTHWTAYKKNGSNVLYFNSFGNLRPTEHVVKYFNSNGPCTIQYNHDAYQTYNSVNCGHLCLSFLYKKCI